MSSESTSTRRLRAVGLLDTLRISGLASINGSGSVGRSRPKPQAQCRRGPVRFAVCGVWIVEETTSISSDNEANFADLVAKVILARYTPLSPALTPSFWRQNLWRGFG
jgi:hypothetical protein